MVDKIHVAMPDGKVRLVTKQVAEFLTKKGGRIIQVENNNNLNKDEQIINGGTSGTDKVLRPTRSRKPRKSEGGVQPKVRKTRGTK